MAFETFFQLIDGKITFHLILGYGQLSTLGTGENPDHVQQDRLTNMII